MAKVIVYHSYYPCDTGCCGHVVSIEGGESSFEFSHPCNKDFRAFVKELVTKTFGAEHVADIDWDNCIVSNN